MAGSIRIARWHSRIGGGRFRLVIRRVNWDNIDPVVAAIIGDCGSRFRLVIRRVDWNNIDPVVAAVIARWHIGTMARGRDRHSTGFATSGR